MKWREMLTPTPEKILLTMVLPFVLFVVAFELTLKPNVAVVNLLGQPVFSENPRFDILIKSLIFASVYSVPNWIWSYPLSAFIVWKWDEIRKARTKNSFYMVRWKEVAALLALDIILFAFFVSWSASGCLSATNVILINPELSCTLQFVLNFKYLVYFFMLSFVLNFALSVLWHFMVRLRK